MINYEGGVLLYLICAIGIQCKSEFREDEIREVEAHLPELEEIFNQNGEITDLELSQMGFNYGVDTTVDKSIETRRRTIQLTHPILRETECNKRKAKLGAKNSLQKRRKNETADLVAMEL